jgi:hypothetical protein
MRSTRSTWPPKSACPGVSIRLIFTSRYWIAQFFEKIVIPRSRSRSLRSIISGSPSGRAETAPAVTRRRSTSVVFPWSTCAMTATLRIEVRLAGGMESLGRA